MLEKVGAVGNRPATDEGGYSLAVGLTRSSNSSTHNNAQVGTQMLSSSPAPIDDLLTQLTSQPCDPSTVSCWLWTLDSCNFEDFQNCFSAIRAMDSAI